MGWPALMQAIYGLHVHVSVPDEEHAIRAVAALSRNVPLFVALSANSPFWAGSDTRLASVRAKVFGLMPRTGLPPAFRAWEEFEGYVEALVAAGIIPDYSLCWWDARPHPRLGTVELRAPDAQTESWRVASLAALAQCLVATANEHPPGEPPVHGGEQGAKGRAARYGLDARLHDFSSGRKIQAREAVRALITELRPVSQDLRCEAELEEPVEMTRAETGAEMQRAVYRRRRSMKDVVGHLAAETA
jgi:carboxylate-amine ligase